MRLGSPASAGRVDHFLRHSLLRMGLFQVTVTSLHPDGNEVLEFPKG